MNGQDKIDVAAAIVTYNPEIERLLENVAAVRPQVKKILIVDNGSGNLREFGHLAGVDYIKSAENKGIAWALNRAFEWANENSFSWLLTLDQDSVIEKDYVQKMSYYTVCPVSDINRQKKTAIVYPKFVDARIEKIEKEASPLIRRIRALKNTFLSVKAYLPITSGCLTDVAKACECTIDEDYFIDDVDHYFDFKLLKAGYAFCEADNAVLDHRLGVPRGLGEETNSSADPRFKSFVSLHQAWRYYYMYRNRVWLHRFFFVRPLWFVDDILFIVRIPLSWLQKERSAVLAMMEGLRDGLLGKVKEPEEIMQRYEKRK